MEPDNTFRASSRPAYPPLVSARSEVAERHVFDAGSSLSNMHLDRRVAWWICGPIGVVVQKHFKRNPSVHAKIKLTASKSASGAPLLFPGALNKSACSLLLQIIVGDCLLVNLWDR